jgi:hypothetical protein
MEFTIRKMHRVSCKQCGHLQDCYDSVAALDEAESHIAKESENYQSQAKGRRQGPEFHAVEIQKVKIVEKD